jgi:RNA polymerase sigma factor (sigma-70 family)
MLIDHIRQTALQRDSAGVADEQLLACFVAWRDEGAFAALVRRHGPMVLGVCRRILGHSHDAEDAFQATFLVLARKASSLGQPRLVGSWLYGVAYRTAQEARLKAARRRAREKQVPHLPHPAIEHETGGQEVQPVIEQELSRLPDKYRVPVVLCELEGRSRKEAAQLLRLPEGTLSSRLAAARKMLARRLTRRGLAPSAFALAALTREASAVCVPASLTSSTVQAAVQLAAGPAATAVLSAEVTALLGGVLRTMFLTKLKKIAVIVLVVGALVTGAGMLTHRVLAEKLPAARVKEPAAASPKAEDAPGKAAALREARTLQGHPSCVSSVAFSPDGSLLASASTDGTVKIWETATGKELLTLKGHQSQVNRVAFSPDRERLASGAADALVKVWDVKSGKEVLTYRGHAHLGSSIHSLAFSPDGKRLASGNGSPGGNFAIKVWDPTTGLELLTITELKGMISSLAFSPDGKRLASASGDRAVRVWNLTTGQELVAIKNPNNYFASVVFSPDGKRLASANDDRTVTLWDAATGQELLVLKGHNREVTTAVFSPDGTLLASAGFDATVKLWDATTGKELDSRGGHAREVHSLAFSPDGKLLASSSADGVIKLWEVK